MSNYADEARKHIDWTHEWQEREGDTLEANIANAHLAVALATLELAEQQRIANLIALSQSTDGNGLQAQEPLSAIFTYTHPDPEDGFEGLHIRPEIAAALKIEEQPTIWGAGEE